MDIIILCNFISFVLLVLGLYTNYTTTKKLYLIFVSSFIALLILSLIPHSNTYLDILIQLLELICIISIMFLYYFLKKHNLLNRTSNLTFIIFFITEAIIISENLYSFFT
ncbi:hypothetical protein IGJ34_000127 [Enterococcus sp. AZ177]